MNMTLKSALLGSASFALMMAATGSTQAQSFDGFYVGAQMGYSSFNVKTNESSMGRLHSTGSAFGNRIGNIGQNGSRGMTGATGGLFAGYGRTFGRFYVGGELEGGYSGASGRSSNRFSLVEGCGAVPSTATLTTKIRAKETYGGSLRLGYVISPGALLYSRFGFQRTRFHVRSSLSAAEGGVTVTNNMINQSKSFNGFKFGLGAELALASMFPTANLGNSFVRLDWSHTWYQRKSFFGSGSTTTSSRELTSSHSLEVKPTENRFMLGIGIRF
jgi:outer membrane immunogenic protein